MINLTPAAHMQLSTSEILDIVKIIFRIKELEDSQFGLVERVKFANPYLSTGQTIWGTSGNTATAITTSTTITITDNIGNTYTQQVWKQ